MREKPIGGYRYIYTDLYRDDIIKFFFRDVPFKIKSLPTYEKIAYFLSFNKIFFIQF